MRFGSGHVRWWWAGWQAGWGLWAVGRDVKRDSSRRKCVGSHNGRWWATYDCQPAEERRCCLAAGSAERPGLIERSRERQSATEAAASAHGGWRSTWCAATRLSLGSLWLVFGGVLGCVLQADGLSGSRCWNGRNETDKAQQRSCPGGII